MPQSVLDVERMADANIQDVSDCVIQSVRFHPTSMLMLTAGLDKRLKLFQVHTREHTHTRTHTIAFLFLYTHSNEDVFSSVWDEELADAHCSYRQEHQIDFRSAHLRVLVYLHLCMRNNPFLHINICLLNPSITLRHLLLLASSFLF